MFGKRHLAGLNPGEEQHIPGPDISTYCIMSNISSCIHSKKFSLLLIGTYLQDAIDELTMTMIYMLLEITGDSRVIFGKNCSNRNYCNLSSSLN